jgi:hypothetical protein
MYRIWVLVAAFFVLGVVSPDQAEGISRKQLKSVVNEFNTEWRSFRETSDQLQLNYIEYEKRSFAYYLPNRLIDLAAKGEPFQIRKIRYEDSYVHLHLVTEHEARISFFIFDDRVYEQPFLDEVVPRVLAEVFEFREPSGSSRFVANTSSGLLHLRGCNHLPPSDQRLAVDDRAASAVEGFSDCPVCFSTEHNLPIEGYRSLRTEALEMARLKELAFPPVDDPALQDHLARCGEAVLNNFPIELRGFDYRFKVLHSEIPNAFSISTGFVYVTDKLMAAVEDSLELALILAHEIAHCEMNRTVNQPMIIADAITVEIHWRQYYDRLRFRETECDVLGLLTLARQTPWDQVFQRARGGITKLQFAGGSLPSNADAYATHPGYHERLAMLDPELFNVTDTVSSFQGLDEGGRLLVTARTIGWQKIKVSESYNEVGGEFGGKGFTSSQYHYYFLVETTEMLNQPITSADGRLIDENNKKVGFKGEDLPFAIAPGESAVIRLVSNDSPVSVATLKELKLDLTKQIDQWRSVSD